MGDDDAPWQRSLPITSALPATKPPPPFMNPLPDIRPICTLADAAAAVSRCHDTNNVGLPNANDNDNAAILTSLSSAPLLPCHSDQAIAPNTQLFSRYQYDNTASTVESNSNKKRYKKILCSVVACTNRSVQGGVCVSHGARRPICQMAGCNKAVKAANFCSTHGPARKGCAAPDCSRVAVQGGMCTQHGTTRNVCQHSDKSGDCTNLAFNEGYCEPHQRNSLREESIEDSHNLLKHDDSIYTSTLGAHFEEHEKQASVDRTERQPISSLDLLCSVTMQSLNDDMDIAASTEVALKHPESRTLKSRKNKKRGMNCGKCEACLRKDCGECRMCLDKPKFGGKNTIRRRCCKRQCLDTKHTPDIEVVEDETEHQGYDDGKGKNDHVDEIKEVVIEVNESTSSKATSVNIRHERRVDRRGGNCGACEACLRDDCGECKMCLDKPKFGGQNIMKRKCVMRQCLKKHTCGVCDACLREDCGECKMCLDKLKFGGQNIIKRKCAMRQCLNKHFKLDLATSSVCTNKTIIDDDCMFLKQSDELIMKKIVDEVKKTFLEQSDEVMKKKIAHEVKNIELIGCNESVDRRNDELGNDVLIKKVNARKLSDEHKNEGKRMKLELAKIKSELDAKAKGKKYGLKPPQYPTFKYATSPISNKVFVDDNELNDSSSEDGDFEDEKTITKCIGSKKVVDSSTSSSRELINKIQSTGMDRGVTVRPSGKWQVQLYYAGASRYIGLFSSRKEACSAYETARECMKSFTELDPSQAQILRNLDKVRKAAISNASVGLGHDDKSKLCYETKMDGETMKTKLKAETSTLIRSRQVSAASPNVGLTNFKSSAAQSVVDVSINNQSKRSSDTRHQQPNSPLSTGPDKSKAHFEPAVCPINDGEISPNRLKQIFSKADQAEVEAYVRAGTRSSKNGTRSPVRSKSHVQPKDSAQKGENRPSYDTQNGSNTGKRRNSMSSIYENAIKLAEELPRGITVRPSGKWQVQLYYEKKSRYLGVFDSKLDAAIAYELARDCCSSFERDPPPEQVKKNVVLMRQAAFTVQTGGFDSGLGLKKKQRTTNCK